METRRTSPSKFLSNQKLILAILVVMAVMPALNLDFFGIENLLNILTNMSVNGMLSLGMTLLMISGAFDISLGSNLVLSGAISILLIKPLGVPLAIAGGIASGAVMGLINGILVAKFKVNSFIATLGTMVIFQGATFSITDNRPVSTDSEAFYAFAMKEVVAGIPRLVFFFFAVAVVVWALSRFTRFGKYAYAIGGSSEACRRMGIKVDRYVILLFVLSGVCGALGGVCLASKIMAASAIFGENIGLLVIAGIVIGGVSLSGGVGRVGGVVQGILLIAIIDNATNFVGLTGYFQLLFRSLVLLGVIIYDRLATKSGERRLERLEVMALGRGAGSTPQSEERRS